jgi:glycosyltransferase involved in cell wall biosynthesis
VTIHRVLHLNTERGWRGGERQTLLLALELRRRGHQNWIAARPSEPLAVAAGKEGVPVIPVRPWGEADLGTAARLARFAHANDLSLFHAHTGHAVGLGALAQLLSFGKVRLVATRRVDNPISGNPFSHWKYARVDGMGAVATRVAEIAAEGGVPKNKIRVIHSGVDRTGYPTRADRERVRAERGFSPRDVLVVNAGALVEQKDQATFIRAAELVRRDRPEVKFVILGEGPLRSSLESLVYDLDLESTVFLWGHRSDVIDCTAMADLFVLSSIAEGIGGALIDAMAVEVPTVATRVGGLADLYGSAEAPELTPARDPAALAKNILWVLGDTLEYHRRVEQGRRTAARFTSAAMADAYEELYGAVLNP